MQQIERWGVIALVFFLVTIVAISFWGDSKSPNFWSRLKGGAKQEQIVKPLSAPPSITERAVDPNLPLSPAGSTTVAAVPPSNVPTGAVSTQAPIQPGASVAGGVQEMPTGAVGPVSSAPSTLPGGVSTPGNSTNFVPTTVPPSPATVAYEVQRGDSFARIASKRLGSEKRWTEIRDLNNGLDPRALVPGMKIQLPPDAAPETRKVAVASPKTTPAAGVTAEKKAAAKESVASKGQRTYVVQKGDHLTTIAARELGDAKRWKEIVSANPGLDANKLAVGQKLEIPGGAAKRAALVAALAPASGKPRVR